MAEIIKGFTFYNVVVRTTDWVNEASGGIPTYSEYPFRADIPASDINGNYSSDVRFNYNELKSRIIGPVSNCTDGKIMIYAAQIPSGNITIPAILCTKLS